MVETQNFASLRVLSDCPQNPVLPPEILQNFNVFKSHYKTEIFHLFAEFFIDFKPDLAIGFQRLLCELQDFSVENQWVAVRHK